MNSTQALFAVVVMLACASLSLQADKPIAEPCADEECLLQGLLASDETEVKPESIHEAKRKNEHIRFGKRKNEHIRFGKRKNEHIRFGRAGFSADTDEFTGPELTEEKLEKRKNEHIRFGKK